MKNYFLQALLIISTISVFSQDYTQDTDKVDYDKKVHSYTTLEDFKNEKSIFVGEYYHYNPDIDKLTLHFLDTSEKAMKENKKRESKKTKIGFSVMGIGFGGKFGPKTIKYKTKKIWGFKVYKFVFRVKKSSPKMLVAIIKNKEKVFYVNGGLYLNMIGNGLAEGYMTTSNFNSSHVFYSDDLNSEIKDIKKFIKKEKDNPKFTSLVKCLKNSKKRSGTRAKFNSYLHCIENF